MYVLRLRKIERTLFLVGSIYPNWQRRFFLLTTGNLSSNDDSLFLDYLLFRVFADDVLTSAAPCAQPI